ncbi:MAG: peptidase domain protein [Chloroflexi bacterium]|nr:peptidase domain protein [Chloroflexota bacterium]
MSALDPLEAALAVRPVPGAPRPYHFPAFVRARLSGGLPLLLVHLPGRPLVTANLVLPGGAVDEPPADGGSAVLAARALTEGTERYDAVALVEASERLGASLRSDAGWDATVVGVDVPVERLAPALELLAEVARRPTFPEREVARLRDQRLNDILQARADPGRRADEAFVAAIYEPASPFARPSGGLPETVATLDPDACRRALRRWSSFDRAALVVGGDLDGVDAQAMAESLFGDLVPDSAADPAATPASGGAVERTFVHLVHRPGSVQSEIRIGHVGLARRNPGYHAVVVMSAILGGLFNSRLNLKLREEKGYTYGAGAGFDMRRLPGPFSARMAVNTEATVAAIADTLAELRRIREQPVGHAELATARDYLVGVFPLRFETPAPVVSSLAGLVTHELPDDELDRYRPAIEAVTADDVQAAARDHLDPERTAIVIVGDADALAAELEAAGFGPVEIVREEQAATEGSNG